MIETLSVFQKTLSKNRKNGQPGHFTGPDKYTPRAREILDTSLPTGTSQRTSDPLFRSPNSAISCYPPPAWKCL